MDRSNKPASIGIGGSVPQPTVNINDNGTVDAKLPSGESVTVHLYGATVISWKLANGAEQLFVSSKAILDGSKAIRGGIPVVFPVSILVSIQDCWLTIVQVFGPPPPDHATSKLAQHGFARSSNWEFLGKSSSESLGNKADTTVKLDFGLSSSMIAEESRKAWPYEFGLVYSVTLSPDRLETSLQVQNKGSQPFDFHVLLHNYFKVPVSLMPSVWRRYLALTLFRTSPKSASPTSKTRRISTRLITKRKNSKPPAKSPSPAKLIVSTWTSTHQFPSASSKTASLCSQSPARGSTP